jgi:glycosyltransferase involved in cell wall biosynthesis
VSDKVKIVQFTDDGKLATIKRIKKLHRVMKESAAEVVIPFLPIISLYTMIANIGLRKKVIMSERADPRAKFNNLPWKDKIGDFFMRKCCLYSLADWMVFQTPDAQSYYSEKIQKKSSIIPNPLDTAKLPGMYEGEREKRIVAAGRFSEEKNFALLIDGFAAFHERFPEYTLTIYGEGALRRNYEMQIQELGLEEYVKLPGFASDLPEEINKAAMYVSTSNHEGISNSMLEALGMGVPTIVTDCPIGGAKMFVHTGVDGILIPMNDKKQLVEAMNEIVANRNYARRISLGAVKIRKQLDMSEISKQWLNLI